jgi:hypothetical protein
VADYAALKAELSRSQYAGTTDARAAELANAATAGVQRPRVMAESEMIPLLSSASFNAVFDHPRFHEFKRDIDAGNNAGVALWAQAFAQRGTITAAEAASLSNYAGATEAVTVPLPESLGFGAQLTAADVAIARGLS